MSFSSERCPLAASACLGGVCCRYDGTSRPDPVIVHAKEQAALACPECLGGLAAPRPPAEIQGGDGFDVLDGRARVMDSEGRDLTEHFILGAERFLEVVRRSGARRVFLKSKSPSCGVGAIYDGTFTGRLVPGCGVAAALLQRSGMNVSEI